MGAIHPVYLLITVALGLALGAPSSANADDYSFTTIAVRGASITLAHGINDAGDVVGQFSTLAEPTLIHGFLIAKGHLTTFDAFGGYVTVPYGINNAGQIVGMFNTPGGTRHRGFLREPDGTFKVIDVADSISYPDANYTDARGINTNGEIAGYFTEPNGYHGFLRVGGDFTIIDAPDLLGIHGINDSRQMVGYASAPGGTAHGLLVSGGTPTTFDVGPTTVANGINNAGEIVGTFRNGLGPQHGFVRDARGNVKTVDPEGSTFTHARGINNGGQIVGWWGNTRTQNGFVGKPSDVELVIAPIGYDDWLPEGSLFEDVPGDRPLSVRAVLRSKRGGPLSHKATTITFTLTTVSREPGIAINYPRDPQQPPGPDLKLASGSPSGWVIAADGQSMQLGPGAYTEATGTIAAFDFGAYGVLAVTATTDDGQTLTGHLEGQPDATELVIPKRDTAVSFIADKWKAQYGAAAASDDADLDGQPVGSGKQGDYLTAYEEYRGVFEVTNPADLRFIRHVRTDPGAKDVFIRDLAGIGLDYFTTGNLGAPVHVLNTELWDTDRVVNYNHGTAHVNDQRGIKVTDGVLSADDLWGVTITQSGREPFIPDNVVGCKVYKRNIEANNAELRQAVGARDTVLPYKLAGSLILYRPAGGAVRIGSEEIDYETSRQLLGVNFAFVAPLRRGEMHPLGTAISSFVSEVDVEKKVLAHEAGHAVGLDHFGTESGPCDGYGKTIMSIPMCAGSTNGAGYWPVFKGSIDPVFGQFDTVLGEFEVVR